MICDTPVSGLAYVSTFLGFGVLLLQLAILMNVIFGLPTRNVMHMNISVGRLGQSQREALPKLKTHSNSPAR